MPGSATVSFPPKRIRARCRHPLLWCAALALAASATLADPAGLDEDRERNAEGPFYDEMTIVGTRDDVDGLGGAADVIGQEVLQRFGYADIQRIVRQTPGVSVQVEDGYGLRPNISIRGVASERSGRITLLEDNVLIAPAPYSAPSAYYFPTAGRMHAFEILKGPSAITQGPYTIGGALNMLSTPIPGERTGSFAASAGEDATWRAHATYGGVTEAGFGFLVETHQWFSDGFQDIDRSRRDTGLAVRDYTVKMRYAPRDARHGIEFKLQTADQASDQSYLGLVDRDFAADPFRRYGLSALDRIETAHDQVILRYDYDLTDDTRLTSTAYLNEHERDWFKTEGIDFGGVPMPGPSRGRAGSTSSVRSTGARVSADARRTSCGPSCTAMPTRPRGASSCARTRASTTPAECSSPSRPRLPSGRRGMRSRWACASTRTRRTGCSGTARTTRRTEAWCWTTRACSGTPATGCRRRVRWRCTSTTGSSSVAGRCRRASVTRTSTSAAPATRPGPAARRTRRPGRAPTSATRART